MSNAPDARPGPQAWATTVQPALAAAEQYLRKTVSSVRPGLSVRTLLRVATGQRRHLSALASACRDLDPSLHQPAATVCQGSDG